MLHWVIPAPAQEFSPFHSFSTIIRSSCDSSNPFGTPGLNFTIWCANTSLKMCLFHEVNNV